MTSLRFRIYGLPVAQGSTRAFVVKGRPVVTSTAKGLGAWRNQIASAVIGRTVVDGFNGGPFEVHLIFYMPRPKSLSKKIVHATKRPDIDKLARAALDALTHIIWKDDSQVVILVVEKRYATPGEPPGLLGDIQVIETG